VRVRKKHGIADSANPAKKINERSLTMKEIKTLITVGNGKKKKYVKVYASEGWLDKQKPSDPRTAEADVLGKAYNLLEIRRIVSGQKVKPKSVVFTDKAPANVKPLFPGMEFASATSTYCCICNDANPPECACVPCNL
jgi:hypothetical protein